MTNLHIAPWRKLALTVLLAAGTVASQAQDHLPTSHYKKIISPQSGTAGRISSNPYVSSQGQNVAGTYTDLGTAGTVISTANTDDANSAAQNVGFAFSYNGVSFTQFVLNTNGFIKLGAVAPTATNDTEALLNSTDANIIAPASGVDLQGAADQVANPTEFRVVTTGAPGSQVCTIQFKNLRDKASLNPDGSVAVDAQLATMQFQIKLYEGTNTIEFVYGAWTATTSTPLGQPFLIGLKGNALSSGTTITQADLDELSLLSKPSQQAWSGTVFTNVVVQGGQASLAAHFIRNTFLPDAGRTYRFRVVPASDAAVQYIYAIGKTPPSTPQVVQAVIRNVGSAALTNLAVTLNVTGATTFTNGVIVPTLAPGAATVVSFGAFTPTATGTNTITVAVPTDGTAANNTQTYSQQVQGTTFAYYNPALTTSNSSAGFGTNEGVLAVKFNTSVARTATSVAARIEDTRSVGNTIYAVLLDAAGTLVGRSANYTVATADIGTLKSFTLNTPVALAAGEFYVGIAQTANATTAYFPVGTQAEAPTRAGAIYVTALTGGAPVDITTSATNANIGLFIIEAVTNAIPQGTSEALNKAVAMFPNPSNGLVKLDIRGANAKGRLNVTVINQLGQTVYTSALKDNLENQLDLSSLSNGLYLLKVQTGADYTTRQLMLTK
ncbi:T9SS type A sorting domain-containing protein [uncultured Hymenobacter sp.]|uniref:T9SS type A sorting domain-containing protein n=1 Tax=uncultured Hymenobacter sp. TaxID=170016 RepID=UPI0035CB1AA7